MIITVIPQSSASSQPFDRQVISDTPPHDWYVFKSDRENVQTSDNRILFFDMPSDLQCLRNSNFTLPDLLEIDYSSNGYITPV